MSDYPKIEAVAPLANFELLVTFVNRVEKIYNCRPLLTEPPFEVLQSPALFRAVKVDAGGYGIFWNDDLDLSEAELWRNGVTLEAPLGVSSAQP